ncbi:MULTISPECIES: hypothetical protein [Flavobacterium]|uniref:hypothetical protein n=1 Tax=Flavobacterium TaxID=237 RepID=UPI0022AC8508|nr:MULTISPECIES: hypothetical protein [Flavobacterium]
MKTFWKFTVLIGLFIQFNFAFSANQYDTPSFQNDNSTTFNKESLSSSHFIQPSIDKGSVDQSHTTRIRIGINDCNLVSPYFICSKGNNLNIVLSDQDIDRCIKVSILLFPFHYFW